MRRSISLLQAASISGELAWRSSVRRPTSSPTCSGDQRRVSSTICSSVRGICKSYVVGFYIQAMMMCNEGEVDFKFVIARSPPRPLPSSLHQCHPWSPIPLNSCPFVSIRGCPKNKNAPPEFPAGRFERFELIKLNEPASLNGTFLETCLNSSCDQTSLWRERIRDHC